MAIPTIAFEDIGKDYKIKYELNASLDELVLNYCNTYDSFTINKLYSGKEILEIDKFRNNHKKNHIVKIKKKPLNPKIFSVIKKSSDFSELSNLADSDLNFLDDNKKEFVRTVLPLVIRENQKISSTRNTLIELKHKLYEKNTLNNLELKTLKKYSEIYKIKFDNNYKNEVINDLLNKIDIIPNSIVLAQAAIESGWGSSRFARDYNALFGEYTYDNNSGVIPLKREKGDKHLIKSFKSYNSSVQSYFNNINTHYAYKDFRDLRNVMRERNNFSNISLLVEKLETYAEDKNYIETIKSVIKKNKFQKFDSKTISY